MTFTYNILIVDDISENIKVAINILKDATYNFSYALGGEEAIGILKTKRFDLVLLDVMMPGINGYEVCKLIKNTPSIKDTPVIFLTAKVDIEAKQKGFELGAVDYIIKPFHPTELKIRVKNHLEFNRTKRKLKQINMTLASDIKKNKQEHIEELEYETSKRDHLLRQQSKMAAMGEMMDAVAHQWKQPLNSLSMMNEILCDDFEDGIVTKEYITKFTDNTQLQISHMIDTLNEFRTFFRPSKESSDFTINECIESVQLLMKDELIQNTVNLNVMILHDITLSGRINEFKHLFLNLLRNSIDAFNENNIEDKMIDIKVYKKSGNAVIIFEDNANGISEDIIENIFKPNITTKGNGEGTGIGLYMSSQIVQSHNGEITVENIKDGAKFSVTIKL